MANSKTETEQNSIRLSIRLDLPDGSRFGPGKAALLSALVDNGSISSAARALDMSYPKALRLIDEMNRQFRAPLVATYQGGAKRGGATVSGLGLQIMSLYSKLTRSAETSNSETLGTLKMLCELTEPLPPL